MHSDASWQQQGSVLHFQGAWTQQQVAKYYAQLPLGQISHVVLRDVTRIDSSFIALLLTLAQADVALVLSAVSDEILSLIQLYGLSNWLIFEQEASV